MPVHNFFVRVSILLVSLTLASACQSGFLENLQRDPAALNDGPPKTASADVVVASDPKPSPQSSPKLRGETRPHSRKVEPRGADRRAQAPRPLLPKISPVQERAGATSNPTMRLSPEDGQAAEQTAGVNVPPGIEAIDELVATTDEVVKQVEKALIVFDANKVTPRHQVTEFVSGNWRWLWPAVAVPVAGAVWQRRKKRRRWRSRTIRWKE